MNSCFSHSIPTRFRSHLFLGVFFLVFPKQQAQQTAAAPAATEVAQRGTAEARADRLTDSPGEGGRLAAAAGEATIPGGGVTLPQKLSGLDEGVRTSAFWLMSL